MILRAILTLAIIAAVGLFTLKERPELLYSFLMSESVTGLFSASEEEMAPADPTPGLSMSAIPFLPESRSLSATFQPIIRDYAARLSVPTAHASVIMDANSGKVLYNRNAEDRRQIASLTKLFTALIVVERVPDLSALVTIDEEAVYTIGTRIGCPRSGYCPGVRFAVGEQLTVHDLLKAALMQSANDAAIALGKHVGGTQDGFAAVMNARAQELGLTDSLFCTPSGLEIDGAENRCYSSARDIALIASEALKHPILWEIMKIEKTDIVSADGKLTHEVFNTDQFIGSMPNLVGTKTGFTPLAGYSLLAVATDPSGEHPVIAVVLNDPYRWDSIRSMFDWSFESFDWI
jgi:D-alanyl-D-alanine carboxypeptidase (penicillin-binding protein 5/6)